METKFDSVLDLQGNAVVGAGLRVLTEGRQLASIAANPTSTDITGEFSVTAPNGKYFYEISVDGQVLETRGPVSFYDVSDAPPVLAAALAASTGATLVGYGTQRLDQFLAGLQQGGGGSYVLPVASATVLGGIKVGANLSIDAGGVLSAAAPATGSAGAVVLLGQATVGATVANIDFLSIFSAAYDQYVIEVDGPTSSTTGQLAIRLAVAGEIGAISTGGSNYLALLAHGQTTATGNSSVATGVSQAVNSLSSQFSYLISGANNTTLFGKRIDIKGLVNTSGFSHTGVDASSIFLRSEVVTGFRLFWSGGGVFTKATVRVYGIKNS